MKSTVLLLIDLQRDFLESRGRMPISATNAELLITTANRMIQHAESIDWQIVFIKNEFEPSDRIANFLRRYAAIAGSSGTDIDPRVKISPRSSAALKTKPSAFSNQEFVEQLQRLEIREIVVLGVMAEGCVRATVKDAIKRGYSVTVVSDGVASTRDFLNRFGLKSMQNAGAIIQTCSEILNR